MIFFEFPPLSRYSWEITILGCDIFKNTATLFFKLDTNTPTYYIQDMTTPCGFWVFNGGTKS